MGKPFVTREAASQCGHVPTARPRILVAYLPVALTQTASDRILTQVQTHIDAPWKRMTSTRVAHAETPVKGPSEVLRKELERWWLLGQEEVSRVTALRDVHDRTRGKGSTKREHTRMEGIIESRGDTHGLAGKRRCVGHDVVGGEVRCRGVGAVVRC